MIQQNVLNFKELDGSRISIYQEMVQKRLKMVSIWPLKFILQQTKRFTTVPFKFLKSHSEAQVLNWIHMYVMCMWCVWCVMCIYVWVRMYLYVYCVYMFASVHSPHNFLYSYVIVWSYKTYCLLEIKNLNLNLSLWH